MSNSRTLLLPDGRKVRTASARRYAAVSTGSAKILGRSDSLDKIRDRFSGRLSIRQAVVFDLADGRIVAGLPAGMSASPLPGGDTVPAVIARHYASKAASYDLPTPTRPVLVESFTPGQGWTPAPVAVEVTVDVVADLARRGVTQIAVGIPGVSGSAPQTLNGIGYVADFAIRDGVAR